MKVPVLFLSAALLLALATPAFAQDALPEGTRVRVKAEGSPRLIATLRTLSADSIWLVDSAGRERALARQNTELERSLGKHTRFWQHFAITVMATSFAGGLLSAMTHEECEYCIVSPDSRGEAFVWGFVVGGALGAPIGALLGTLVKVERWEQVPPVAPAAPIPVADLEALRAHMNKVFQAQEIHWSHPEHNKYASAPEQLAYYESDPGITLSIWEGTEKGWAGMIQDASGHACVMYVGTVARVPATPRGQAPQAAKQIVCD